MCASVPFFPSVPFCPVLGDVQEFFDVLDKYALIYVETHTFPDIFWRQDTDRVHIIFRCRLHITFFSFSVSIPLPPFFRPFDDLHLQHPSAFDLLPFSFTPQLLPAGVPRLYVTDILLVTSLQITAPLGIPILTWLNVIDLLSRFLSALTSSSRWNAVMGWISRKVW